MKRYIRNTSPEELQQAIDEYTAKQKEVGSQLDDLQETVKRRFGLKFHKRGVESKTEVDTYRNKRNPNKYVEVHRDGYGHRSAKQYMHWDENDVTNPTGDGNLHRWRKGNMDELLEDYDPVESAKVMNEYIVHIWHEIDPGYDAEVPAAQEEIFQVTANDPEEATSQAIEEWGGPVDNVKVEPLVDKDDYEIPFASTCVNCADDNYDEEESADDENASSFIEASSSSTAQSVAELIDEIRSEGYTDSDILEYFIGGITSEDALIILLDMVDRNAMDIDISKYE